MLNLDEFEVTDKQVNEYYYVFHIQAKEKPTVCPMCTFVKNDEQGHPWLQSPEYVGKDFKQHSYRERELSDIPIHGKPVKLVLKHKRYRCPICNKTFYEQFKSIDRAGKITIRLRDYIQAQSFKKPFSKVAEEVDMSPTSVKNYFEDAVRQLDKDRKIIAPRVLGIDEAHLNKTMRGVFTDTENNKLLEISKDNLKRTVKEVIQSMEGYENIEVVTIDMYAGYKYACRELIPNVIIVIDKFHVIQYVIRALEEVRKEVKRSLPKDKQRILTYDRWTLLKNKESLQPKEIAKRDMWFEEFPELGIAYWLKENLRDMYDCKTKYDAFQKYYYDFQSQIPDTPTFQPFKDVVKTFENNKQEIFNYFDRRETNAYTESINNIIKSVEKEGKGYSFEVLRAKVLYGTNATKRPKFKRDMDFKRFDKLGLDNLYYEGFEVDLNELKTHLECRDNQ